MLLNLSVLSYVTMCYLLLVLLYFSILLTHVWMHFRGCHLDPCPFSNHTENLTLLQHLYQPGFLAYTAHIMANTFSRNKPRPYPLKRCGYTSFNTKIQHCTYSECLHV